ncbi:MAG: outer membrane protein assembly factor [Acidobacteriia bacterium]|nr:outer membrane protein assembly factor [Terriglobia bacterium]
MKYAWLGCLVWGGALFAGTQGSYASATDTNVNARYKVETVIVSGDGWTSDIGAGKEEKKLSSGLRKRISALIGDNLNPSALDDISKRIRDELHAREVTRHLMRGASPESVKVVFKVSEDSSRRFDISVPKFLYNSKQGWSGAVEGTATVKQNGFTFGLVSDGDELPERYAGLVARYENKSVGTDRLRFQFEFESYHEQWNNATVQELPPYAPATGSALETSQAYRTRQNFEPALTLVICRPLTLTVGASFERMQNQFPAAHTVAANTAVGTLRYQRQFEGADYEQDVDAAYNLRAATRVLDSDFVYARHHWALRYMLRHGRHVLLDDVAGGVITGRAPLFERYVLGNSSTLRGWNKFDLDPLGGNRMVHNSVEYRYGFFEIFYDTGAIWDSGLQSATPRHGVGVGLRQGSFSLAVAFPVRSGRADPIFMMGMNY